MLLMERGEVPFPPLLVPACVPTLPRGSLGFELPSSNRRVVRSPRQAAMDPQTRCDKMTGRAQWCHDHVGICK